MTFIMRAYGIDGAGGVLLQHGKRVEVPTWQSIDASDRPQGVTHEVTDFTLRLNEIPGSIEALQKLVSPNMPWAEHHFQERVGGEPLNPGRAYTEWPWYHGNVEEHKEGGQFSHSYMERYWPKGAYDGNMNPGEYHDEGPMVMGGIRFKYGDLMDVVNLLAREPMSRQAYLPVWFPEDTGVVHGERVPCSLGYQFLMREEKLNITYHIRSCDFYRYLRDDVYLTCRLAQWVLEELGSKNIVDREHQETWERVQPGRLTMHIGSLHVFEGDLPKLRKEYGNERFVTH